MLQKIYENTLDFLISMDKETRKKKGQFFTTPETAEFMAGMFDISILSGTVTVLDPGTGTGILSSALIERLNKEGHGIKKIQLTVYENDKEVLPVLKKNLDYMKEESKIPLAVSVIEGNYLLTQKDAFNGKETGRQYDLVIGNPPYLRIPRDDKQAKAMPEVVHGAPNLYFMFLSMSLFNLKKGKELVYIIPRSWTSGLYFETFRKYLFTNGSVRQIHLFVSRDKVFNDEQVLQETIIVKVKKDPSDRSDVLITSSESSSDFNNVSKLTVPYDTVVSGEKYYVYLPTNGQEMQTIQQINRYKETLPDIGIRMKTGIVVDFRQWKDLRKQEEKNTVPLFYSQHIRNGRVNHEPSGKETDWVVVKQGLVQKNKDYVFCKRFTAKEERRRLQCGIYLAFDFPKYQHIGTQNKINFVEMTDGSEMDESLLYGVYCLLNSTLFDSYYRILNGSTQVNSTEVNSIPVPPIELIRKMGEKLIKEKTLTTDVCDKIMGEVAYE